MSLVSRAMEEAGEASSAVLAFAEVQWEPLRSWGWSRVGSSSCSWGGDGECCFVALPTSCSKYLHFPVASTHFPDIHWDSRL